MRITRSYIDTAKEPQLVHRRLIIYGIHDGDVPFGHGENAAA